MSFIIALAVLGTRCMQAELLEFAGRTAQHLAAINADGTLSPWNPMQTTGDALVVSGDTVFVGGKFKTVGGEFVTTVAIKTGDGNEYVVVRVEMIRVCIAMLGNPDMRGLLDRCRWKISWSTGGIDANGNLTDWEPEIGKPIAILPSLPWRLTKTRVCGR